MLDSFYLAWQYLPYNKLKTAILIACITIISALPLSLNLFLKASEKQLTGRAKNTPLLIGNQGSELDLAISSLYFTSQSPAPIAMADLEEVRESKLAQPIPLYLQFQARNHPIIGTTVEYFPFRNLTLRQGRYFNLLGDCVLGATVARRLNLKPGDSLISSPDTLFALGGIYPLKMKVVGILAKTNTADDDAIFTDIKTTWIIQGLGHGHLNLTQSGTPDLILKRDAGKITANAKLRQYNEITPENIGSFHFHGEQLTFPITAIIAIPLDQKSEALLRGRYQSDRIDRQILKPTAVVEELLVEIFKIRNLLNIIFALVILATSIAIILIFNLSLRLRQDEIQTSFKLGCSRAMIARLIAAEVLIILAISFSLTSLIVAGLSTFKQQITRTLIS